MQVPTRRLSGSLHDAVGFDSSQEFLTILFAVTEISAL